MSDHDEKGRFVSGNTAALQHGGRSRQVERGTLATQAEAVAAMAESMAVLVNDLGGPDEISQLQRDLMTDYLRLGLITEFSYRALEAGGVFTAHGKQRAAVQTLMKAIAQRHDIARTLGLKRQQKRVPDLSSYLRERERA